MTPRFGSARDLFEAVREASRDASEIRSRLSRLESACGLRAQRYDAPSSRGVSDAMHAVDIYVDQEERLRRRQDEDYELIALASSVIYGTSEDGSGGIQALLGPRQADAMWWRFCAAKPWQTVADMVGASESWCKGAVRVALDTVDSYGWRAVAEGVGVAEG
jgi:hypothetical protein